ncbi:MAG: hypothetical protein AVDCRST_MAG73-1546 [uncultured Thermomicrobiales bacterium]|uniref:Two-component transcriptional response regulator, LuxR family n=1 Tax=uncultured Thermomicrobiales bacterium TaxID=1645740 RepID=A0A6J4U260_9BACT|nr:MAG: hypothetical protein AVDCRST_MAG73-1546 [uncultured Thermomicrobiales bacterium]
MLVDDHSAFRQALAFVIGREADVEVVAQAGSIGEARRSLAGVDVAVVDLNLSDGDGVTLIPNLRSANPSGAVLVLSGTADRVHFARAVEAGAAGVLHKTTPLNDILDAIRQLRDGKPLLSTAEVIELLRLAGSRRERDRDATQAYAKLTARERDMLQGLADGLGDKDLAERYSLSVDTVRTHMVNLLRKLGVGSRLQALLFAVRLGVITIE